MLREVSEQLAAVAAEAAEQQFGVRPENVSSSTPPRYDLGDIAFSFPFEVAKRAGGGVKPRDVAARLAPILAAVAGVRRVEVAGGGYINVFLDRGHFTRRLFAAIRTSPAAGRPIHDGKVVIEHTNINPNKAAHIGHVRNAVLGDTLARTLRALGHEVEVQNYIDDTGVQVADVVVGFLDIEGMDAAAVRALPEPFDHYCWDLYARVGKWYEEDPERKQRRQEVLHALESGHGPAAEVGGIVARRVVDCHLATAAKLGVTYDLLAWEGDILRLGLWARTFEDLKKTPAVQLSDEGKTVGCWVMKLEGTEGFKGMEEADKILVRSNGTATYVAKDIAYQMWKFGISALDFRFARYTGAGAGYELWTTTSEIGTPPARRFGHADRVYNVIDVRQSYLQNVVARGLEALGYPEQSRNSVHYSYEMVALTPRCMEQLGVELDERDRNRPYVEMSGRRGLGIKADDLRERLTALAREQVVASHQDRQQKAAERGESADPLTAAEATARGDAIALGALRYFMLRYGRTKVVAFDLDEALKFQGETGPYLQYSVVRCHSIFRKLADEGGPTVAEIAGLDPFGDLTDLSEIEREDEAWDLIHHLGRLDEAMVVAVQSLELSILARWAFQTAQRFHKYFERYRIRGESDPARRRERAAVIWAYARRLEAALDLMGIPVPDRM